MVGPIPSRHKVCLKQFLIQTTADISPKALVLAVALDGIRIISSVRTLKARNRRFLRCRPQLVGMDEVKMPQVGSINPSHLLETTILDIRHELLLQKVLSFDQIDYAIERFQCALRRFVTYCGDQMVQGSSHGSRSSSRSKLDLDLELVVSGTQWSDWIPPV